MSVIPIAAVAPLRAPGEGNAFLSTELAGRNQARLALCAALGSVAIFIAAVPFATRQLAPIPAFIPAYEAALGICDLITAALLLGQFRFLRARALLVLACGYLFTALIAFVHALTFPGVFSPGGLLGAGTQTTAWLYMIWHAGFPLFVIGYAATKGRRADPQRPPVLRRHAWLVAAAACLATAATVAAITMLVTGEHALVPHLIAADGRFTPALTVVVTAVWMMSLLALAALASLRPYSVLDLWLMVVMCAWLADIALSAVLNGGRFDLGWYAGRMYGLVAASSLLMLLLLENGAHYPRLARLSEALGAANTVLEGLSLKDALTGLANRRNFDLYLDAQIGIARRHGRSLALVLCDVDAFKAYNDRYGHPAGDECLKLVANALRSCCRRPGDLAARYGGEEFALILPDTDAKGAARMAEAVRLAVARLEISHPQGAAHGYVSVSGGMAQLTQEGESPAEQIIRTADRGLYEAKRGGRNRMIQADARAA